MYRVIVRRILSNTKKSFASKARKKGAVCDLLVDTGTPRRKKGKQVAEFAAHAQAHRLNSTH